jgi:hypothetical protein
MENNDTNGSSGSSSNSNLIESMHDLFYDPKWRPDENLLHEELFKHNFYDFRLVIDYLNNNPDQKIT